MGNKADLQNVIKAPSTEDTTPRTEAALPAEATLGKRKPRLSLWKFFTTGDCVSERTKVRWATCHGCETTVQGQALTMARHLTRCQKVGDEARKEAQAVRESQNKRRRERRDGDIQSPLPSVLISPKTIKSTPPLKVAYQGEPGAYSEQAALEYFTSDEISPVPCPSFPDIFEAVASGKVDCAAVPIENSLAGTIHKNYDLLLKHRDLKIVGELDFRVRHCLMAMPGAKKKGFTRVLSHEMALGQCVEYLDSNKYTPEVAYDTAGAAKILREKKVMDAGAIASQRAAEIYNLEVIAKGIETEQENYTRFWIVAKDEITNTSESLDAPKMDVPSKTSIAFTLNNKPGMLFRALSVFAVLDIDLTKIESRHVHTLLDTIKIDANLVRRWGYVFYVDFARSMKEIPVANAMRNLQEITPFFRVLGSYPRVTRKATE